LTGDRLVDLDGTGLTPADVEAIGRHGARVRVTDAGWARIRAAHDVVTVFTGPAYGRTTGVGANKNTAVGEGNGRRLLRSHAGGAGATVPPAEARAMLAVRVNQLAAGGAGVAPGLVAALVEALDRGLTPPARRVGAIGTGDLTALATTGLCLVGERAWRGGTMPAYDLADADAVPLISSSAATVGSAALAWCDTDRLLRAMVPVGVLSMVAVDASLEPFAGAVHASAVHAAAGPPRGQGWVAGRVRALTAGWAPGSPRVQDSYAYRAWPQVQGAAVDAADRLDAALAVALNAAPENPLVDVAGRRMLHNGNFHTAALGAAVDGLCAALGQAAALSATRLASLVDPAVTGLRPFLADAADGSSGVMILEYVALAALAELRGHVGAAAAAGAGGTLSMGAEEHASFATQSVHRLAAAAECGATVVACELVAAARAVRQAGRRPPDALAAAYREIVEALPTDLADRPLDRDLDAAVALLPALSRLTV